MLAADARELRIRLETDLFLAEIDGHLKKKSILKFKTQKPLEIERNGRNLGIYYYPHRGHHIDHIEGPIGPIVIYIVFMLYNAIQGLMIIINRYI